MTTPDNIIAQWLDDLADAYERSIDEEDGAEEVAKRLCDAAAAFRAKDERIGELERRVKELRNYALMDANCPCCGQDAICEDECTFADDCPSDFPRMVAARAALADTAHKEDKLAEGLELERRVKELEEALESVAAIERCVSEYMRLAPDAEIGREQLVAVLFKTRIEIEAALAKEDHHD